MDAPTPPADRAVCNSLDEFTASVEASAVAGEFNRETIAQVYEQLTWVRPSTPCGSVVAVVLSNARGQACQCGHVDGVGLVVGIPAHLAAFVIHSPKRHQVVPDIARFHFLKLQNYKFFSTVDGARAWAYSTLVAVGAATSEAKTFADATVKPFLQFALECGDSPVEIMRNCPFVPLPNKAKMVRQKRRRVDAPGSLLKAAAAAAARAKAPMLVLDDVVAASPSAAYSVGAVT
ncbi:hypothetical protein M885DRAFT_571260 [Pelagophyceae sp. CCMP2097]|nr:hypothetical protein M885DRAFT_571260 [Pelagophyceae sp. CCMP2097]